MRNSAGWFGGRSERTADGGIAAIVLGASLFKVSQGMDWLVLGIDADGL